MKLEHTWAYLLCGAVGRWDRGDDLPENMDVTKKKIRKHISPTNVIRATSRIVTLSKSCCLRGLFRSPSPPFLFSRAHGI